MEASDAEEI